MVVHNFSREEKAIGPVLRLFMFMGSVTAFGMKVDKVVNLIVDMEVDMVGFSCTPGFLLKGSHFSSCRDDGGQIDCWMNHCHYCQLSSYHIHNNNPPPVEMMVILLFIFVNKTLIIIMMAKIDYC